MKLQIKKLDKIAIFSLFFLGCLISYNRASNFSDGDAYSVILAFLNMIDNWVYTPSRGAYGHPIPELLVGFFAFTIGTPFSNIFCFILFFLSLIILFKTFCNQQQSLTLFLLLILSNFYLLFENTNSIDYPIAIFFFSLGLYFLKFKKFVFSFIFFGMTIASRANFLTFVYPILLIYFYDDLINKRLKNFLYPFIVVTVVGLFFYIPLFYLHNFTLNFLDLPFLTENTKGVGWYGGPKLNLESLGPRFLYKIYLIVGIYSSILFIFYSKKIYKNINFKLYNNQILLLVIFVNLFVFFFMPTKILIINPFIIFLYIISFNNLNNKHIIFLIFFNLLQWFVTYEVATISYKHKDICKAVEATNYSFKLSLNHGKLYQHYFINQDMTKCYSKYMGKYSENFINGKPLFLSD